MNKNELAYELARQTTVRIQHGLDFAGKIVVAVAALSACYMIMDGLRPLISGQSPAALSAFAEVVSALDLGSVVTFTWAGGATIAWRYERNGKKRAIRQKSALEHATQEGEPNRTSSGLTPTGETPTS